MPRANVASVAAHYEEHPYPRYPLWASLPASHTYGLDAATLWMARHGTPLLEPPRVLVAGCGSFLPYPFSLANPQGHVTALDLSQANLSRAAWHLRLHGRRNVALHRGDLLDPATSPGPFHLVDAFGVLHHLPDPAEGLRRLRERLAPGGLLRVMLYARDLRRTTESARRALRRVGVRTLAQLDAMVRRAPRTSRLRQLVERRLRDPAERADALLHPLACIFTTESLRRLIDSTGLYVWRFAHPGARLDPAQEWLRLETLERDGAVRSHYVVWLSDAPPPEPPPLGPGTRLIAHPRLQPLAWRPWRSWVPARMGRPNPPLDRPTRALLRRLKAPTAWEALTPSQQALLPALVEALFVVRLRPGEALP